MQLVVKDQFNLVLLAADASIRFCSSAKYRSKGEFPMMIAMVFVSRQQPQNVFDESDFIEPHRNHRVLVGQHGWFNPAHFDCREQHRRCRKQVCPVSLDEASRGSTYSDDQIGRSLSVERREIFNKFGLCSAVVIPSRGEGLFLNVKRPGRLSDQFFADFPAPCAPRVEIGAK